MYRPARRQPFNGFCTGFNRCGLGFARATSDTASSGPVVVGPVN
ncbi:hypothetical protein MPS_3524 [Mycobacterium pseudoshottsii JCM 15466]|nr:hypothetical protein MMSP_5030 [Mycobacterium sp. 012931]GAQ37146.1 hypothetical protein MPS_3524 [Mycobacterium pseudoshottsii JCM 15466]